MTLGQYLRQEREQKAISVEQVASATRIGVRTIHAIEADQYADLPAKPFVRGFVSSYARFIGIDPKETLTRYGQFLEEKVEQERPNREAGHSGYAFEKRDGEQRSRTVLAMVLGVFVLIGIAAALLKPHHSHHETQVEKLRAVHAIASPVLAISQGLAGDRSPSVQLATKPPAILPLLPASSATPSSTPLASASPTIPTAALAAPTPSPAGLPAPAMEGDPSDPLNSGKAMKGIDIHHRLVVKFDGAVWVRYRVDTRPIMQFPLKSGKVLVLRARDWMVFQVSRPENVRLSYNNEGYHSMSEDRALVMRQNDATLFYPHQLTETVKEPFPGEENLATRHTASILHDPVLSTSSP